MTRRALLASFAAGATRASDNRRSLIDAALAAAGFAPGSIDYLLLGEGGSVLAEAWPEVWRPVAPGSLLKPFVALAYAQTHGYGYPRHACAGERAGCWLPAGHGEGGVEDALAGSCNVFFRALPAETAPEAVRATAAQFGLPSPPASASRDSWWGLGAEWTLPPERLLAAYRELAARRAQPGVAPIIVGLRRAADRGTAAALRGTAPGGVLAKTGTAPCAHPLSGGAGDGYACVLAPAAAPRQALLVRAHGRTGREAARAAAVLLASEPFSTDKNSSGA